MDIVKRGGITAEIKKQAKDSKEVPEAIRFACFGPHNQNIWMQWQKWEDNQKMENSLQ